MTIGFSSISSILSCFLSRLNMSEIFLYADEPLDELDTDELGEKLLSLLPLANFCGFSSPIGLPRCVNSQLASAANFELSSSPFSAALSSFVSSMSHVSCLMRSSSEISDFTAFFLI